MADMFLRQIALVSESDNIDPGDLARVGAALQKQVSRDLIQFWNIKSTVETFPTLEDVPIGYWPIIVMDDIGFPGAAGTHLDENGQPFALVTASDQLDVWSLTASHELIEMLVDPFGNRLIAGDSPKADQKRVQFLVEPSDPSEAADFAYTVNGILCSDFYTVRFFDPIMAPGVRYSFTGALKAPRQVIRGGYLSWLDVASNSWWQVIWFGGNAPMFRELGPLSAKNGSFRSQIDRLTFQETQRAVAGGLRVARAAGVPETAVRETVNTQAASLRRQIESLTGPRAQRGIATEQHEGAQPMDIVGKRLGSRGRRGNGSQTQASEFRTAPSVAAE